MLTTVAVGSSCTLHVRFAPSQAGDQSGVLTVTDSTSPGQHVVALTGRALATHTSWALNGDPGEWVGGNRDWRYTPSNALFTATGNESHVQISVNGDDGAFWHVDFAGDPGHPLLSGTTLTASSYPDNETRPGIDVGGDGRGCGGRCCLPAHAADRTRP